MGPRMKEREDGTMGIEQENDRRVKKELSKGLDTGEEGE